LTPAEWQEVKALLAEALEQPAGQRAAWLDRHCGDATDLRRELEALLAAAESDGFLDGEPTLGLPTPAPAIAVGEALGPYKIEKKLGEGGMGEVYQAFDSRLARRVAVKVLPARLSQDAAALKRFERETKVLARLSHPNILTIFDAGRHGDTVYAVTELLTGETLRQRLAHGRLPVAAAIEIAVQAARGLAVAHAEGIVHRDLKPENLFVTAGGPVKILDFGIAVLTGPLAGEGSVSVRLTANNVVIGTAGYMSPEQAQGQSCDHRSDLFSLGAVLYEMLAGRPAFPGETPLLAYLAVIDMEPVPLATLCPAVSPQLAGIVHRCLEKDPGRRCQSAGDLAFHLESLAAASTAPTAAAAPALPAAPVRRRRGLWRAGAVTGLLLAAAFLAGLLAQRHWGRSDPLRFQRLTFRRGGVGNARFAPDGRTIVYSAFWDGRWTETFTARTDSPESRSLGLPSSLFHSISKQGEMLIGLTQVRHSTLVGYTLARMPLAGGAPRPFLESHVPQWLEWAPDGETFATLLFGDHGAQIEYPRGKGIWSSESYVWDLRMAPTGDALAFCEDHGDSKLAVVMLNRAGKVLARSEGWSAPPSLEAIRRGCVAWGPDGKELWFAAVRPGREAGLYALTRGGEVRPLLRVPGELALYDVARDGRVLLTQVNRRISLVARAPGEARERSLSWFESSELADLSVDGRWVLFTESGPGGGERTSVYLRGTDGAPAVRLGDGWALALSPDGRWALARGATDSRRLSLLPTGVGEPRALPPMAMNVTSARWMPDGKQLLISGTEPGKGERLYLMAVGAKEARPLTRPGVMGPFVPSPDGSRVALRSFDGVEIYPVGGGAPSTIPGGAGVEDAPIQWRADGRALYLARYNEEGNRVIDEVDLATGQRRRWKELRAADAPISVIYGLLMTPDGQAYAYDARSFLSSLYLVAGLR
jgi:hypothetical protein